MGHLLKSINPEAAEAIRPAALAERMPDVGDIVIYHMRSGHGRQGRTRFPALVQGGEAGRLNLTVILESSELRNETMVEQIGPGKEFHVWERPDISSLAEAFRGTLTALHTRIGDLEGENKRLRDCVLGDFDIPKISIIAIMQDFENRLRMLAPAGKSKKK